MADIDDLSNLLAAAQECDLWREADGTSVMTAHQYFGFSEILGEYTEECRLLESVGLIESRPLAMAEGAEAGWVLTAIGRAALAELKQAVKA
jgi:hypothetical protein